MAITSTPDDVICVAPELEGQEKRIEKFIETAKLSISESVWGDLANFATELLTAHILTMLNRQGSSADVKRKKLGDTEIEFGVKTGGSEGDKDFALRLTAYGLEYLRLRDSLVITPIVGC